MGTQVGNFGNDVLTGIEGEENNIYGDGVYPGYFSVFGSDIITGGAYATNTLYGDAAGFVFSAGGNDTITGGAYGTNTIYGDAEGVTGTGGDDILTGGAYATNTIYGDAYAISGTGGNDTITGGAYATNYLYGDAHQLNDGFTVGGNDRLISGAYATDHIYGGGVHSGIFDGNDTFSFGRNNGNDIIYDLHQGEDVIDLSAMPSAAGWARSFTGLNRLIKTSDADSDGLIDDSVIRINGQNSITVLDVTNLKASDFDLVP